MSKPKPIPRQQDLDAFVAVTTNELFTRNLPVLRDLFNKSIRAKNGEYPLWSVQVELMACIQANERARRGYSGWEKRYNDLVSRLRSQHASAERVSDATNTLLEIRGKIAALQFGIKQLRSVGDGVAWRFFGYDRPTIRALTEHQYVPVVTDERGSRAELDRFAVLTAEGSPVLLNNITNCLRFGDLTTRDESTGMYDLIEVKAGLMRDLRTKRQTEARELALEGLRTGVSKLFSIGPVSRIQVDSPLMTYLSELEIAMSDSDREFASARVLENYLSFCVFSLRKLLEIPESESNAIREQVLDRCWSLASNKSDMVLPVTNIPNTIYFSPMLAPYTIYPISSNHRFGLLTGDYIMCSYLNIHGLVRLINARGWEVKFLAGVKSLTGMSSSHSPVIRVRKQGSQKAVELGLDFLMTAAFELWKPDSIERMLQANLEQWIPGSYFAVSFQNEGEDDWD